MGIVGTLLQRVEHVRARCALIRHRAIAIILKEVTAVQYRQRDRHLEVRPRGHVAEYVSVRVPLPMAIGLLEAELDEETEELTRVERAGDVRRARTIRQPQQQQAEQERVQPLARDRHFTALDGQQLPPTIPRCVASPRLALGTSSQPQPSRADRRHPQHPSARHRIQLLYPQLAVGTRRERFRMREREERERERT